MNVLVCLDLDLGLPRCFRALGNVSVSLDLDLGLPRCFRALRGVSACLDLDRFLFCFFRFFYGNPIYFTVSIYFTAEVSRSVSI